MAYRVDRLEKGQRDLDKGQVSLYRGQQDLAQGQKGLGWEAVAFFLYGIPQDLILVLLALALWHCWFWYNRK